MIGSSESAAGRGAYKENEVKVYLLWTHLEDGPEELIATLDASKVLALAKSYYTEEWMASYATDLVDMVEKALKADEVGIFPLTVGWGGLHFQVVELA